MRPDESPAPERAVPGILQATLAAFVFCSTFSIAGTQTALGLSLLLWLFFAVRGRAAPPGRTPLDAPLVLFVAACVVAALLSSDRAASFRGMKNLLLASAAYLVGWCVTTRRLARSLFVVLAASAAGSALFGVAIFLLGRGEGTLKRTPGSFSTAMTFGGIMLLVSSVLAAVAVGGGLRRRARLAVGAAALASLAALFFSFTRSSWIGMVVAAVVILAFLRRRWIAPFAIVLAALVLLMPAPYRARVASIFDPSYRTNVQRVELLQGGLGIVRERPVFGVGTRDLAGPYRAHMPPGAVYVHGHLHNIFLQVAAQTGLVGLAAFAYLLVALFLLPVGNLRLDLPPPERAFVVGSLAALAGFVVNGLFEWNFGDAEVVTIVWLLAGANVALRSCAARGSSGTIGA